MSIEQLDIHPRILKALRKVHLVNFEKILSLSSPDVVRSTGLSPGDVQVLKEAAAEAVPKPTVITALDIWNGSCSNEFKIKKLSTGCCEFDKHLRGGFISRGITEICGESASGKTQLCLQLCLACQLPVHHGGLNGGAVYLCTEDAFPNKRLHQLIHHFSNKWTPVLPERVNFGDNIFVEHVADLDGLQFCIHKKFPVLLAKSMVKVIVIDSVAALFRCEFDAGHMVQRAKQLSSFANQLHRLSHQNNIPIICVNQVSANMSSGSHTDTLRKCIPSLGLTWANQVTSRFMLSRTEQHITVPNNLGCDQESVVRVFEVMFAPNLPTVTFPFIVDHQGVKAITELNTQIVN